MGLGDGATLKVDPDLLSRYGEELQTAAARLPDAPAPFIVSGTDPISLAIAGKLPDVEGGIQEALPQLKTDATKTASNIVSAAGQYKGTDEQLAADYEKHQFDQAGGSGAGGSGAGGGGAGGGGADGGGADAMSQFGQMMSMPMQMASQAAQLPMQAMGAVAAVPQAAMQGVQQIRQMAGGLGKSEGVSSDAQAGQVAEQRDDEEKKEQEAQPSAAAGTPHAERVPDSSGADSPPMTSVPQQTSPRHAAPDPELSL